MESLDTLSEFLGGSLQLLLSLPVDISHLFCCENVMVFVVWEELAVQADWGLAGEAEVSHLAAALMTDFSQNVASGLLG